MWQEKNEAGSCSEKEESVPYISKLSHMDAHLALVAFDVLYGIGPHKRSRATEANLYRPATNRLQAHNRPIQRVV